MSIKIDQSIQGSCSEEPSQPVKETFYYALADGKEELALKLLETGEIDLKAEGQDILITACKVGCVKIVTMLLESGCTDVNKTNIFKESPLSATCSASVIREDHLLIAQELLGRGANVNARDATERTVLMELMYAKPSPQKLGLGKLLIAQGVDVHAVNDQGKTCLDYTLERDTIELLVDGGVKIEKTITTLLKNAIERKNEELIRFFVARGADIHEMIGNKSLIRIALEQGDPKVVAALLNKSIEEAQKMTKDYQPKFLLGHINSMEGNYEYSNRMEMLDLVGKHLQSLPKEFSSHIQESEKRDLIRAFQVAASERFEDPALVQSGTLTIFPVGYDGHAIHLVFCNGYMAICNRGNGALAKETIKVFKIDPSLFTQDILETIDVIRTGKKEKAIAYYYQTLPSLLSPRSDKKPVQDKICKQLGTLSPKIQKIGNCAFAQAKTSARIGAALLKMKKDATLSAHDLKEAYRFSKDLSTHMRLSGLDEYLKGHTSEKDGLYDKGLVQGVYRKLKKRLSNIPQYLSNWGAKLEREWKQIETKRSIFIGII